MDKIIDYIYSRMTDFKNDMEVADKNHCAYMHSYARGAYDTLNEIAIFTTKVMMETEENRHEC